MIVCIPTYNFSYVRHSTTDHSTINHPTADVSATNLSDSSTATAALSTRFSLNATAYDRTASTTLDSRVRH